MPLGIRRVEGYGPREQRETHANVFAREFLLPATEAKQLFETEGLKAPDIAARLGVPLGLVHQQLSLALLTLTPTPAPTPAGPAAPASPPLDDTQREAAETEEGPLLLEAGPGTGKTRTLVARIVWLVHARGASPESTLALTYSNKAAEELRERVGVAVPAAATAIWAGTFHAFGLEFLRKHGHLVGLPPDVPVIDPSNALLMLEEELPSLPLSHYLRLYDPALALRDILAAISRAKDELVTPERYLEFGEAMLSAADSEKEREDSERAIEIAKIYAVYQGALERRYAVDFGDLIWAPIRIMAEHQDVRDAVRQQYRHILVDEYQDVNRASGVLLKVIAGDGKGLWVVGDARQSIYRFRGASPRNIREFGTDFPGYKRLALGVNYRSKEQVVRLFEAFAPKMRSNVGGLPAKWEAKRGKEGGRVLMEVATDRGAEGFGIAREIQRLRGEGVPFRDQAVLCRSHTSLARFAALLERHGIPVLYLGDLFERPEVRDLLSLLSSTCEPERGGLLRVATFPEYSIPLEDVRAVLAFARANETPPLEALRRLAEIPDVTDAGRGGLARLAEHLKAVGPGTQPSALLASYLFSDSNYLEPFLTDGSVTGQQRRLAPFQFLQFAFEHSSAHTVSGDPKRHLLRWIRRLETFGDERQLRQMPSAAAGIDAVRLMTVHASKGLEFRAVYLPGLGNTMFPVSAQHNPCPPPHGMLRESRAQSHSDEEECLFFVAMSRARDHLCLSRAETYGSRSNRPSPFLDALETALPRPPTSAPTWTVSCADVEDSEPLPHLAPNLDLHNAEDLDQFMRCPRSYLYQRILDLSGARDDTAYVEFHRSVYAVLRWMSAQPPDAPIEVTAAFARLDQEWATIGPSYHPWSEVFLNAARAIVETSIARRQSSGAMGVSWVIARPRGKIRVRPDFVQQSGGAATVRRLRTGRVPKTPPNDDIYALYHEGAGLSCGPGSHRVEVVFLTSDEAVEVSMSAKVIGNRLEKYDDAMNGIATGEFPPLVNERNCPRCPQYFICPSVPKPLAD